MTTFAAPPLRAGDSGGAVTAVAPRTGRDYLNALRDDRAVYINGERVRDVTEHPALRNAARSIARLYDALHAPDLAPEILRDADTGDGRKTHAFFRAPRCAEDLVASHRAITAWSRLTYGWMGRSPDYKAALTTTFGAVPDFYGPFEPVARAWYRRAQHDLPFICHAIANPPIDRHQPLSELKDILVHAHRETSDGIIVSGAKVVATSAAITEYCFIGQTPNTASDDPDMALSFFLPIAAPGVKIICRASYEHAAHRQGSPFDYPLASRFDENDAILTLDNVLIPWEHVLIHRDPARTKRFFFDTGFVNNFLFHGCTRFAVKLEFIAGLLAKALRATGGDDARGKRALLGEVIAWSHTFDSLARAMALNPDPLGPAAVAPNRRAALAYCVQAPDCYPRIKDIIEKTVASGLIYLPSAAADLDNPDIAPQLARYVRGSGDMPHSERIKILKLLWDCVGSEFAGRHELYERNYAGGWECIRLMAEAEAHRAGRLNGMEALVDTCLADYDQHGWINPAWSAA